jgi:hypothetical protein
MSRLSPREIGRARGLRHVLALVCALLTASATPHLVSPAGAQPVENEVRLELVRQPPFHRRNDLLGLRVRIINQSETTLRAIAINVNLLLRENSRFGLQQSYDETTGFGASANRTLRETIEPGQSEVVAVDVRVSDLFADLGITGEGVYPLIVTLLDSDFVPISSFVTPLLYYPDVVENPLKFVLVVPLNGLSEQRADGTYVAADLSERGGSTPLESAIQRGGWLREVLDTVLADRRSGLRLGIAPTPRLIEEVADMRRGYRTDSAEVSDNSDQAVAARTFVADLSSVLHREGVQPLLVPYAWPDLPVLAQSPLISHVGEQVGQSEAVLASLVGVSPGRRWLFPPAGRLDEASVGAFDAGTATRSFFTERSLAQGNGSAASPCANPSLTFTCPVAVDTAGGSIEGYVADQGLQDRIANLARPGNARLDMQRLFAETAMIREEQPSEEDRVVHAILPELWEPSSLTVQRLLGGFREAPWLQTVTPREGLSLGIEPVERQIVGSAPRVNNQPGAFELADIADAAARVDRFSQIQPPDPLIQRMKRNILVAESRSWWAHPSSSGRSYATDTIDEIDRITDGVRVEVSRVITLTSRSEDIPMRVVNDTGFPVRLELTVDSPALTATVRREPQIFPTEVTPITVGVRAEASGVSRLDIRLLMPNCFDENCVVFQQDATIRSTDFNNIALAITIGAFAFLVGFYALRWVRRHRERPSRRDAGTA